MLHHLIHLLVTAVAVLIAARIVPGIRVKSFGSAVVFAFVLAVLNVILGKILIVLALPFVLLTLGLFLIVINGFGSAVLGSLVTSVLSWAMLYVLR